MTTTDILRLIDAELRRGDQRTRSTHAFPALEVARLRDIEATTTAYREQIQKCVADWDAPISGVILKASQRRRCSHAIVLHDD